MCDVISQVMNPGLSSGVSSAPVDGALAGPTWIARRQAAAPGPATTYYRH